MLEKSSWTFGLTGKEATSTGLGILSLCDTIIATGKSLMTIQRYKGLGEMNPEQLWETTMNPVNRRMIQVTIDDTLEAERKLRILMSEQVEPRREFMMENIVFTDEDM